MSSRKIEPEIDVLPEQHQYRDEGCSVSPSCLRCPLPWCKYDDPVAYHRELRLSRDREVMQVKRDQGKSVPQLARQFCLSERTIHRILERSRVVSSDGDGL